MFASFAEELGTGSYDRVEGHEINDLYLSQLLNFGQIDSSDGVLGNPRKAPKTHLRGIYICLLDRGREWGSVAGLPITNCHCRCICRTRRPSPLETARTKTPSPSPKQVLAGAARQLTEVIRELQNTFRGLSRGSRRWVGHWCPQGDRRARRDDQMVSTGVPSHHEARRGSLRLRDG